MAKPRTTRSGRQKGSIDELPSGALRVRVYAGVDPVTKRRHDLIEVVPPGPKAYERAEATRARLVASVAERRNPRTSATIDQLLEKYLDQFDGAPNTLTLYRGYVNNHISPLIGRVKVGTLEADVLDSFYAELRRCRKHCDGRPGVDHRVDGDHDCNERCRPHSCRPLAASTVRHMHFILSGAYRKAVRWKWVAISPVGDGEPPAAPKANPQPPTPEQAALILNEAWRDPDWGALLWVAMTTGARRGELCAVRWSSVDLEAGRETLWLRRAIRKEDGMLVEAELKTHQQRRVALDPESVAVLREHRQRCADRASALGIDLSSEAFVFSGAPDGAAFPIPDSVTQRYERLANRLGIVTTLHKLRHYSATELIAAGVDVRTVAGRLGHGGGGTTTLRTYTAWVSEADQRAAASLTARMPQRPTVVDDAERARTNPSHPYETVAASLAESVRAGELQVGDVAPTAHEIADRHGVSLSTARRAVALSKSWGLIVSDGRRRLRIASSPERSEAAPEQVAPPVPAKSSGGGYWSVTLVSGSGVRSRPRLVRASLDDPDSFAPHAEGIAEIEFGSGHIDHGGYGYELEVCRPGNDEVVTILRLD
ncbi:MAG: tyrosine-type recombinase/integrase [Pseudonocardia sp.]|uniref:tyrosine-type recombinase/integrase n=1 Tax=unclassified Pseudonocardia TaxID=2619320 RepID=UPI0008698C48|nr:MULTISPECIES: tyrosine-type recombinase/integrase [unclassified Pseudonocardia]MBN9113185.1 tyrosine-type recombinase/integrase [Pseudonocardia sp.]ODU24277.1 MAG: integrase [Pseudonocardia sp. SCN 72-51]ODV01735.1 MAG: integrase [Pseudonocardia sp. SCN 73-27]